MARQGRRGGPAGDTVVEISTDKVDVELPAPASGTLAEILAEEGATVTVGQVIARLAASTGDGVSPAPSPAAPQAGAEADTAHRATAGQPASERRAFAGRARAPRVEGVDLAPVAGTGPAGRITKADVLSAAGNGAPATAAPAPAPAPPGAQLMKGSAAALARYMDESRSIPTATSFRTLAVTCSTPAAQLKAAGRRFPSRT